MSLVALPTSTPALPPGFTLRAPWPDELPRLRGLFDVSRLPGPVHLRVLLRAEPERIVGGFLLGDPVSAGQPGSLLLRLRPAYVGGDAHEALFAAAKTLACELGFSAVSTCVANRAQERAFLLAHGALHIKTDCFYEGDMAAAWRRLGPMGRRYGSAVERYTVRPVRPDDHAAIAEMAAAHGLLNAERAANSLRGEHDPEQSLVCTEGEAITGALLVKAAGRGSVYIEVRMVHPAHAARSGLINLRLLTLACEQWLAAGFTKFSLSFDPAKDLETANFARRMGCWQTGEQHTLRLDLATADPTRVA